MRSNRRSSSVWILCLGILAAIGITFAGCGGGGGSGGSPPVATATIQGSVSGTIVMAIDETGKIVAQDDTAGKAPLPGSSPPKYPFTLTVPVGHQYRIVFIVDEGTSSQQIVPLALGSSDIFSVSSTGTINLGYVDTSQATAVADNTSMLTPAGQSGPKTVLVDGARYLLLLDNTDGSRKYRAQIQLKNPDNTLLTNRTLVRDMKVYDNTWKELALNGAFFFWDGTSAVLNPQTDVEGYLQASPGTLSPGFYSVVLTDNNGNLYTTPVWHGTPAAVSKPTNLQQQINQDNSITLTWTNPTDIPAGRESEYFLMVHVLSNDLNADGVLDSLYFFSVGLPTASHTIPSSVVSSVLSGKPGLRWRVEVRQRTPDPISYPDGYVALAQIYRTYSAEATLTLPSPPLPFTPAMLSGKVFFNMKQSTGEVVYNLIYFNADGVFRHENEVAGPASSTLEILTGTWSIDVSGRVVANITGGSPPPPPTTVTVTLLTDTTSYMDVRVDFPGSVEAERWEKTFPFDQTKIPGTYNVGGGGTIVFSANGTGTSPDGGFTWSVVSGALLIDAPGQFKNVLYALAGTVSDTSGYQTIVLCGKDTQPDGTLIGLFRAVITRSSSSGGSFTQADLAGTWDIVQFVNGAGAGLYRGTATVDGSGNITILNLETSGGTPPSTTGIRWALDSSGVVSETVNSIATPFHGTMSKSKDLVVGVQSVSGSSSLIRIARKRVPGVTYGIADLANKSFVFHGIDSGAFLGWSHGTGTIDDSGRIRLTSGVDDVGPIPVDPNLVVAQFNVDAYGIVSEASAPLQFKGVLTADKSTIFFVITSVEGTSTSYELLAVSLVNPAKIFSFADVDGRTYRGNAIWAGTTSTQNGWAYVTVVMGSAGSGTVSGTEPAGSWTALPIALSLTSNGTVGWIGDPTFHGILSPNGAMMIGTVTDSFAHGEFSLQILVE